MTNAPKIIEAIPFVVKKAKLTLDKFFSDTKLCWYNSNNVNITKPIQYK